MLVNTGAIVISALKYGEADLIVKLYTQSDGLKSYMLKRLLKSKKGKFRVSMFQPLTRLEIVAKHKNTGKLEYLQEARIKTHYTNLHSDVLKSSLVMFLAEVLRNSIQEEEANLALFDFLERSFIYLDKESKPANFHLGFLLQLSAYLGFSPDPTNSQYPYFDLMEGVFDQNQNEYTLNAENTAILRQLLGIEFDELSQIKLNQSLRKNFLDQLLIYYQLHIDGFRKPRSLSVLNEIFH
jgi:DNA repair protein RecO (recombination protein O)